MGLKRSSRRSLRVAISGLAILAVVLIIFKNDIEMYDPLGYVAGSITYFLEMQREQAMPVGSAVQDKILVIPALESVDMSWVAEQLPDWQRAIYIVNPSNATRAAHSLVTPMNKGHEAMAYLTYIIDNYHGAMPSIVAFLHSHRQGFMEAWHVDTPLHDNVAAMRLLNLDFVRRSGYVNLRCNWRPGCSVQRGNPHVTGRLWDELMGETSTPVFNGERGFPGAVKGTPGLHGRNGDKGMAIYATCCAQFAVSRQRIHQRPLEDYVKIREWLMGTELEDEHSGRVLEYMWHIIFGMEAVHCLDPDICYCKVYGRC